MLPSSTAVHTFIGEENGSPGHGYGGCIKGERYQLQVVSLRDGSVEVSCAQPGTSSVLVSAGLFARWWQPVAR